MTAAIAEVEVGLRLPDYPCTVTAALQRGYHAPAGVPDGLFGDSVDVSVLANQGLLATAPLRKGQHAGLHMGQRILQVAPIRLGEPLIVRARVAELAALAAGTRLRIELEFARPDGSVPVRGETISLRVDPEAMRRRGPRPEKQYDREGYAELARHRLMPERVAAYSHQFPDDRVHFDPGLARSIGFRVPVAQGLMSLTWICAAAAADGPPAGLEVAAEFRAPIFWDDEIAVLGKGGAEFQLRNAAGRVCSLGRVARLVR